MTTDEKQRFIEAILEGMKKSILAKVEDMPETWDGTELRRYITDYANDHISTRPLKKSTRRYKDYYNDCLIHNL